MTTPWANPDHDILGDLHRMHAELGSVEHQQAWQEADLLYYERYVKPLLDKIARLYALRQRYLHPGPLLIDGHEYHRRQRRRRR